jgi:hypothetical protein
MNDESRRHMEHAINSLEEVKQCLMKASNNAENGTIRSRIETEVSHIDSCLRDCQAIASGFSNQ